MAIKFSSPIYYVVEGVKILLSHPVDDHNYCVLLQIQVQHNMNDLFHVSDQPTTIPHDSQINITSFFMILLMLKAV